MSDPDISLAGRSGHYPFRAAQSRIPGSRTPKILSRTSDLAEAVAAGLRWSFRPKVSVFGYRAPGDTLQPTALIGERMKLKKRSCGVAGTCRDFA
jgi:hypothetical protein